MTILVLDTETAGLSPSDGIVDIAILEVDQRLGIIATYQSLIDPEGPISASASGIHGITYADVQSEPTLHEFFYTTDAGKYLTKDLFIVGHNVQFDIGFLAEHLPSNITPVCTLRLSRHLYPDAENHKLQTLRYAFNLEGGEAHRAYSDAVLCLNLLRHMSDDTGFTFRELVALQQRPVIHKTMPFGKHKGQPLSKLPRSYINWLLNDAVIDEDLRYSLQEI